LTGGRAAMYYMVVGCISLIVRRKEMITHIVLFKLKARTPEGIEKAREILLSMDGKVEQLRFLEVGTDLIHSPRSADIALVTRFDSLEDLQAYQVHPYHANEVAAYMRGVSSSVVSADYQTN
jgi:predicted GTPase